MCGLAGIVYEATERRVDEGVLARMCDTITHRGPDDHGIWSHAGAGLGHQRLSIIDLSPAGHQPMCNEDGSIWTVYNGEIYNFQELRRELIERGHSFRSRTDSEVLVHLYEEEEDDLVERLEGMFAFAIWDVRRRRLLLARDRIGKKPLKYAHVPGGLVFASELKAILASGLVGREVELAAIDQYLSFHYVPSPGTGFAAIRKLPPAHRLIWENGQTRIERYWSLDYRKKQERSAAEWKEVVRAEVTKAVRKRLVSDVPLGALLSGGIDSSIVVACMAEASDRPVETFSIGFEHQTYNELPHAKQIADRYGTSHHEFHVRVDDASLLPALARLYEEPYSDVSALPTWFLARETRREVKVALTGDGGDEGFTGYARYARMRSWESRRRWLAGARPLLSAARSVVDGYSPLRERQLDGVLHLSDPYLGVLYAWLLRLFSDSEKDRMYVGDMRAALAERGADRVRSWVEDPRAGRDPLDRLCYADVCGYLPDDLMVKMDLASMAHSLETRSPLLDHAVLELAAAIPPELRCPNGSLKGLLKAAFRDVFPPELIDRPKHGFAPPIQDWFRGPWQGPARDLLLSSDARIHAYLCKQSVAEVINEHSTGRAARGFQLWALIMLELWHREVVEA